MKEAGREEKDTAKNMGGGTGDQCDAAADPIGEISGRYFEEDVYKLVGGSEQDRLRCCQHLLKVEEQDRLPERQISRELIPRVQANTSVRCGLGHAGRFRQTRPVR